MPHFGVKRFQLVVVYAFEFQSHIVSILSPAIFRTLLTTEVANLCDGSIRYIRSLKCASISSFKFGLCQSYEYRFLLAVQRVGLVLLTLISVVVCPRPKSTQFILL